MSLIIRNTRFPLTKEEDKVIRVSFTCSSNGLSFRQTVN
jgi:hypothetical protein